MIGLSKESYKQRLTHRDEIKIDDMTEDQLKLYLAMYSVYMEWFINLLVSKTDITKFDKEIKNSNLKFTKAKDDRLDFYQKFSRDYLDYFYLRNNLYLYRLNKEEYNFIIDRIKNDKYIYDKETEKFILDTYKKIIFEKVKDYKKAKVNHDIHDMGRYIENNAIIIGIRYDINNDLKGKEWYDNLKLQEKEIAKISTELLKNLNSFFSNNVAIIDYK